MTTLTPPRTNHILLPLWQAISRHLEIRESTASCGNLITQHIPLQSFTLWRLDEDMRRARGVAAWSIDRFEADVIGEVPLGVAEWRRLERWVSSGDLLHRAGNEKRAHQHIKLLQHSSGDSDYLLAPLVGEHGSRGVLIANAWPDTHFRSHDIELLVRVQEAMAVALDNDTRLQELATLREAAEADRQSLLRRLGRSEVAESIVGEESGLAQVMQRVDLVSRSEVPVLILGETGTGKELVSRAIHNRSERHSGPFLRVNCGAIPRELIDSQLFGHERGSFTGASETRQGWFERADMGTLFLDEIGELPLDAQVRFLRVLQDGFVERVGGSKPIRVNVRVVAATHRDLAGMVRENRFREDLWYRIAVFPILLPPLRDRVDDIPELALHFAQRAAIRFSLAPVTPTESDIALLQTYEWPGNIRELGAVIDRAAILGNGDSLELAAALGVAAPFTPRPSPSVDFHSPSLNGRRNKVVTLDDAMRIHIETALRSTRGRVEGAHGAARLLAINPHTLRARMRKLKIKWSTFRDAVDELGN